MNPSIVRESRDLDQPEPPQPEHRVPSRKRGWVWLIVLGIAIAGAVVLYRGHSQSKAAAVAASAKASAAAIPITAVPARKGDMPSYLNELGSVAAFNTVTVRSRVDGQLVRVAFQEGQMVHAGDLLAEIDPRPFQVQLEQAEGQLAKDEAQLDNAKIDLQRYQLLYSQDAVPKQQLDTQLATVAQFEGTIKADQAAIDTAKLQIVYAKITAPISGRIGLRLVDVGNVIHASDQNGLVVITEIQPIAVLFTLPEDALPRVLSRLRTGDQLGVDAYDRAGITKIASGTLTTLDNQIDASTGTLKLKAVFKNTDNSLFPNQFVNVKLLVETKKDVVIIPSVAIQHGPQGTFVYVMKQDSTVTVRPVTPGVTTSGNAEIAAGLKPGEMVVTDGIEKLKEGSKVKVAGGGHHSSERKTAP